ncbi:MAG: DivIVA domain-containing protein [Armatimonadetes bacterium]|nr:DivIVA domain-containing protein [Armatimonadota bacterium]
MKITAIDLSHKKLNRSFRGYRSSEVDDLLKEIASELEDAARDRARLEDQIDSMRGEVGRYKEMEETLNNAILLAQRTADELRASAYREADVVVREAEDRAKQVTQRAHDQRVELLNETRRLADRRDMFIDILRSAARDMLEWLEHRRWEEVISIPERTPTEEADRPVEAISDSTVTVRQAEELSSETADTAQEAESVAREATG